MTLELRSIETASLTPAPCGLHRTWTREEALALYEAPFNDLLFRAQTVHRQHFDPNRVQLSRLLSIKTGGCPEDCGYCSQSAHHKSGLKASKLMEVERVVAEARKARDAGATRYCMGAAWRRPKDARHGCRRRHGRGRQGARHGDLHDARHARSRPGRSA